MVTWLSLELGTLRSTARPLHSAAGHAGSSSSSGKASLTSELSLKRFVGVGYLPEEVCGCVFVWVTSLKRFVGVGYLSVVAFMSICIVCVCVCVYIYRWS